MSEWRPLATAPEMYPGLMCRRLIASHFASVFSNSNQLEPDVRLKGSLRRARSPQIIGAPCERQSGAGLSSRSAAVAA